jgi:hypothetical protein
MKRKRKALRNSDENNRQHHRQHPIHYSRGAKMIAQHLEGDRSNFDQAIWP